MSSHRTAEKPGWWRSLDASTLDPITLEPIRELDVPPFRLNGTFLFDAEALAAYAVASSQFVNPLSREAMTSEDCANLDVHMAQHGIRPLGVARAMKLAIAAKAAEAAGTTEGGGATQRSQRLQRQANSILTTLFEHRRNNHVSERPVARNTGMVVIDDDELPPAVLAAARFAERDGQSTSREQEVVEDFPALSVRPPQPQRPQPQRPTNTAARRQEQPRVAQGASPRVADFPALAAVAPVGDRQEQWQENIGKRRALDEQRAVERQHATEQHQQAEERRQVEFLEKLVVGADRATVDRRLVLMRAVEAATRGSRLAEQLTEAGWSTEDIKWAGDEPRRVLEIERLFADLLRVGRPASKSLRPTRRHGRKMQHSMAEHYNFGTQSFDRSPERYVKVTMIDPSSVAPPSALLSDAVMMHAELTQIILKRKKKKKKPIVRKLRREPPPPYNSVIANNLTHPPPPPEDDDADLKEAIARSLGSAPGVVDLLTSLGLGHLGPLFARQEVSDLDVLAQLDEADLRSIGVDDQYERTAVLQAATACDAFRPKTHEDLIVALFP